MVLLENSPGALRRTTSAPITLLKRSSGTSSRARYPASNMSAFAGTGASVRMSATCTGSPRVAAPATAPEMSVWCCLSAVINSSLMP